MYLEGHLKQYTCRNTFQLVMSPVCIPQSLSVLVRLGLQVVNPCAAMASIKLTNESVEARVEMLQGQENYLAWKRDLKFIAEANDVWKILNGEEIIHDKPLRPTLSNVQALSGPVTRSSTRDAEQSSADAQASDQLSLIIQFYKLDLDEYEKQQKRFQYARGLLSTTINTSLRGCIKDEENTHQAMEKLKGLCKMNDAHALDMTLAKIEQLKFKSFVSDLINTLKTYQQDILDLSGTFSETANGRRNGKDSLSFPPIEQRNKPPAYRTPWNIRCPKIHEGLTKAESTVATLLRTGVIGLNDFRIRIQVPGIESAACLCGWAKQTAEHIFTASPLYTKERAELWLITGTDSYNDLLQDNKKLKHCTQWFIRRGILQQFNLPKKWN
jgi:hypothetical protein